MSTQNLNETVPHNISDRHATHAFWQFKKLKKLLGLFKFRISLNILKLKKIKY